MKLTRQELRNILNSGWTERRRLGRERAQKASERTKEWKKKEKAIKNKEIETPKRQPHHLG